jgi:DNA polymerase
LRQAVASCTACGLCQSRKQTVFGSGAESAHWLVVGEAPGEQEDLKGMPFVGPSGELLDAMLAALHLVRADRNPTAAGGDRPAPPQRQVFVANTVKCRPPKNRNPTAEELATCEPFLLRQIELLQPRIILALGAFAIKALLRTDEPVGKLRGRVHRYQGVPVVVSYHPAYLLRQPLEKARAWEDLCLAADTAQAPDA